MKWFWRWTHFLAGLLITSVFLWLVLRHVHIDGLLSAVNQAQWPWLCAALFALTLDYGVRIYRWWWLLRLCSPGITLRSCAWPLIASFAVNNVVPFRAGDALRVVGFRQQLGARGSWVLATLLIERMLDLTVLLGVLLLGIAGLADTDLPAFYFQAAAVAAGAGIGAWLVLIVFAPRLETLLLNLCSHRVLAARNLTSRTEHHVKQLFFALNVIRKPARLMTLVAMSAAAWIGEGGVFFAVAKAVYYNGKAFGPWFALATGSLSTLVPSSPGFVGTFDFFTLAGLEAYGAAPPVATAAAFTTHAVLWLPLTAAGLTYLASIYLSGRWDPHPLGHTQRQERL